MITTEQFRKLFPAALRPEEWVGALEALTQKYGINTSKRLAAFLAQCGHESGGFTRLTENLNYSSEGLIRTWPKRFTTANASKYARKPEAIANKVYADRMGNGDELSGDGWKYRGAGVIQLTGKANHQAFAEAVGKELSVIPGYLRTIPGGVEGACWFWAKNGLNAYADSGDFETLTRRINGGVLGLTERKSLYTKVLKELS